MFPAAAPRTNRWVVSSMAVAVLVAVIVPAAAQDARPICKKAGTILVTEITAVRKILLLLAAQKRTAELGVAVRPDDEGMKLHKLMFDDFYEEAIAILTPSAQELKDGVTELASLCGVR